MSKEHSRRTFRKRDAAIAFTAASVACLGIADKNVDLFATSSSSSSSGVTFEDGLVYDSTSPSRVVLFAKGNSTVVSGGRRDNLSKDEFVKQCSKSVVQISVDAKQIDFSIPWSKANTIERFGCGAVLSGRRILTLAQVIGQPLSINVKQLGKTKQFTAKVVSVSHAHDLAILTVEDEEFWEGLVPVEIADAPAVQDPATMLYWHKDSQTPQLIQGTFARNEMRKNTYSQNTLPMLQSDVGASVDTPGALVFRGFEPKLCGLWADKWREMVQEETSYLVSMHTIQQYLRAMEKTPTSADYIPTIGVQWYPCENKALRRYVGIDGLSPSDLPEGVTATGALIGSLDVVTRDSIRRKVTRTLQGLPDLKDGEEDETPIDPNVADQIGLERGDVVLALDGHDILCDGTYRFRGSELNPMDRIQTDKIAGDLLEAVILRDKKVKTVKVPVYASHKRIAVQNAGCKERYIIVGGFAFAPAGTDTTLLSFLDDAYAPFPKVEGERFVMRLADLRPDQPFKSSVERAKFKRVTHVDGVIVKHFDHFVQLIDERIAKFKAKKTSSPYITISYNDSLDSTEGEMDVLNMERIEKEDPDTLRNCGAEAARCL